MDILTVTPVAMIEQRFAFLRSTAYFISEYVNSSRCCDYFGVESTPVSQWETVMQNIVVMMRKMYQAKIEHDDLQWGNLLIVDEQPLLLDLDHMTVHTHHGLVYQRAWQRDIEHFKQFLARNPVAYNMFCAIYNSHFKEKKKNI